MMQRKKPQTESLRGTQLAVTPVKKTSRALKTMVEMVLEVGQIDPNIDTNDGIGTESISYK